MFTVVGFILVAASSEAEPVVRQPVRVDVQSTPVESFTLAARDRADVTVGWIVAEGSEKGLYLRHRQNLVWAPSPSRLPLEGHRGARDLQMAHDAEGRLNLAWTAVVDRDRGLFHVRFSPGTGFGPVRSIDGADKRARHEADLPSMMADARGGVYLVWQENRPFSTAIRAAYLDAEADMILDLGYVSGESRSGIGPQILTADPFQVVWYEVFEVGGRLRTDAWLRQQRRWVDSDLDARLESLLPSGNLSLNVVDGDVIGCWHAHEAGTSAIGVLRIPAHPLAGPTAARMAFIDDPRGDHRHPDLGGRHAEQLTLAWQVFSGHDQRICLRRLFPRDAASEPVVLSGPGQRFATQPHHITLGDWSAAVWTDEARDGGTGHVYFNEVQWGR